MWPKALLCFACLVSASRALGNGPGYLNGTLQALKEYGQIYYNPMTLQPLKGYIKGNFCKSSPTIYFSGLPCACVDQSCGCCAGVNITKLQFDRRYCANFTYDLKNLTVDLTVLMNEQEIFSIYSFSAANPPPICVPMPYLPILNFCIRLHDISLSGHNVRTCIDFETRVLTSPILVLNFNCVSIGKDGVTWLAPNSSAEGSAPGIGYSGDFLDAVDFEPSDGFPVNSTTLSPEDEDKIGEHRFTGLLRYLFGRPGFGTNLSGVPS